MIGSLIGGLISKGGADDAAGMAGQAGGNADFIRNLNEAKLSPWVQSGQGAQNIISQLLGLGSMKADGQGYGGVRFDPSNWQGDQQNALNRFQASPDYNFRMGEGIKALDRSAASRGMLMSGAQTKGVQQYGSDLASGEYGNWFNRLMGVSNQGLGATGTGVQSNLTATGLQNNALMQQGQLGMAGANALGSGISNGFENLISLGAYTGMIPRGSSFGGPRTAAQGGTAASNGNWLGL